MPIQVQIEGRGAVAEFPDGTDPKVVQATVKRILSGGERTAAGDMWQMAKNFPGDVYRLGKESIEGVKAFPAGPLIMPRTAGRLFEAGRGFVQAAPEMAREAGSAALQAAQHPIAAAQQGLEAAKGYAIEHPAHLAAMFLPAGPAAGRAAAKGAVRGMVSEKLPAHLYESGAKWSTVLKPATRKEITGTLLKERIPLNPAGYDKLAGTIDAIQEQVSAVLAPVKDVQVSPFRVLSRLKPALERARKTLNPNEALAQIGKEVDEFLENWGSGNLTVENAHEVKKDIYRQIKKHYEAANKVATGLYTDGEVAAKKAIARGLKEEIEKITGGDIIKNLHDRESKLLRAEPHLARAIGRVSNLNMYSLDDVLATIAGATIAGGPGAGAAALLSHFFGMPAMKSKIAIMLKGWRDWATTLPPKLRGEAETILNNAAMQDTKKIDFLSDLSRKAPRIAGPAAQPTVTGPPAPRALPAPQKFTMRPAGSPPVVRRPYPESTGQMVGEYPEVVMKGAKNNILGSDLEVAARIKGDIQAAKAGKRTPLPDGTWTGQGSTWPDYLKGGGYTAKHLNRIIDKALAGEKLTELERRNFNTIVKAKLAEEEEMIAAMNKNALAGPMNEIPTTGGRARGILDVLRDQVGDRR
jgi:hypothetical protein